MLQLGRFGLCLGRIQISPCQLARMLACPLEGSAFAPP